GIVMFVIPFVFALYPELLLIDAAVRDPSSATGGYLPGYDGQVHIDQLAILLGRLILTLYLLASALAGHDMGRLPYWEVILRLVLAAVVMHRDVAVYGPAVVAGVVWLGVHFARNRGAKPATG
ncbi:MAG: C4-dicarboxylate ABC transporter, partial [Paracoccaceae bacterium]